MFARLRSHLTYANVVATIALFVALSTGGVYAASKLKNNSVTSKKIKDGQVANVDLGPNAVTGPKVGDGSLTGADVLESSLQGVDASSVGGFQVRKIRYDLPAVPTIGPYTEVLNLGGLVIIAACSTLGDNLDVKASTVKNDASFYLTSAAPFGGGATDGEADAQGGFDTVDVLEVDNQFPGGEGVGTLHYEAPDGTVVVVDLALDDAGGSCEMIGVAIGA